MKMEELNRRLCRLEGNSLITGSVQDTMDKHEERYHRDSYGEWVEIPKGYEIIPGTTVKIRRKT